MFTKSKNVSTEQSLLEKSKEITNSFTTMISELRNLNTELSNLEASKDLKIGRWIIDKFLAGTTKKPYKYRFKYKDITE